jgi:hypothetical protein
MRWLIVLPVLAVLAPVPGAAATTNSTFATAMQQAAAARQVPLQVVEATAYVNTRWEWINTPQIDGGIGPMKVKPAQMAEATSLTGQPQAAITGDLEANLDAGAALIAHAHTVGTDLASWRSAVAATQGAFVARSVFAVIQSGASRTTSTGETITLAPSAVSAPQSGGASSVDTAAGIATTASPDYPPASWVPADPNNYTVADRPHDYPINLIVIHDIEGTAASAIQAFQDPTRAASAHYVVDYDGSITQMVREKDVAWHAGNWDYNTRAIGIEHAGYASQNLYTGQEYVASAQLIASICSRYGVPMDRNHVIGHYQVPDPNNPGLFGGSDHHTDPGPYWDWTGYMKEAVYYASLLPSPPHMMTHPSVVDIDGGAKISWVGQSCRKPIDSYQVVVNPGNIVINLPGTTTSTTVTGLTNGQTYTVTVTATNTDGTDSNTTSFIPSPPCAPATINASPTPGGTGVPATLRATTTGCTNPLYRFWIYVPNDGWSVVRDYSSSNSYNWAGTPVAGAYRFEVDTKQQTSAVSYDNWSIIPYTVSSCNAGTISTNPASPQAHGTSIVVRGAASCPLTPEYRFLVGQNGRWSVVQPYSTTSTFTWNTTGLAVGTYGLEVDARNHGSSDPYDTYAITSFSLTGCTAARLATNKTSPQPPGTTVVLTASSTCPGAAEYRFLVGGVVVQNYGTSNTFSWNTGGKAFGTYTLEVDVRAAGSGVGYDAWAQVSFRLGAPPCTAATLRTDKASPQPASTTITLTAGATCAGTPEYRFLVNGVVVQQYGTSNTYAWTPTAPGTYTLEVDDRNQGSSAGYESWAIVKFSVT